MKKSVLQTGISPSSLPGCKYNPPFLGIILGQCDSVFSQVPSPPLV